MYESGGENISEGTLNMGTTGIQIRVNAMYK